MATILQRFKKLGIAYSNPVLQRCGVYVANQMSRFPQMPHKIQQDEGDVVYLVNDYPEKLTERLDDEILKWLNTKPDKALLRDWWRHEYKKLPR